MQRLKSNKDFLTGNRKINKNNFLGNKKRSVTKDKEQEVKIFNEAIDFFGNTSQKIRVVEEMSELTK